MLNAVRDSGVVADYALFGAIAQMRYTEPVATLYAEALVEVPSAQRLDLLAATGAVAEKPPGSIVARKDSHGRGDTRVHPNAVRHVSRRCSQEAPAPSPHLEARVRRGGDERYNHRAGEHDRR